MRGWLGPIGGVAAVAARVPLWLAAAPGSPRARHHERAGLGALARGCGIRTVVAGEPVHGGTLFVSNHISWADIPVYGAALGVAFVAKAEVGTWPLIGRMAARVGTIFVARERRGETGAQAEAIRARLRAGGDVMLFAEGTTSDGQGVMPFRSSLFAAADAAARIQPAAIAWQTAEGAPLPPDRLREVAWIGDDPLLPSVKAVARAKTRALLTMLDPLEPGADRKALAQATHDAVAAAYAAATAPNRPR